MRTRSVRRQIKVYISTPTASPTVPGGSPDIVAVLRCGLEMMEKLKGGKLRMVGL